MCWPYVLLGLSLPGGGPIGYMDRAGWNQLNRVLPQNNNVVKSGIQPYLGGGIRSGLGRGFFLGGGGGGGFLVRLGLSVVVTS
jgi:hypothetical protein